MDTNTAAFVTRHEYGTRITRSMCEKKPFCFHFIPKKQGVFKLISFIKELIHSKQSISYSLVVYVKMSTIHTQKTHQCKL